MADRKQLKKIQKSTKTWNKWREQNPNIKINLSKANLSYTNLSGAYLSGAKLAFLAFF